MARRYSDTVTIQSSGTSASSPGPDIVLSAGIGAFKLPRNAVLRKIVFDGQRLDNTTFTRAPVYTEFKLFCNYPSFFYVPPINNTSYTPVSAVLWTLSKSAQQGSVVFDFLDDYIFFPAGVLFGPSSEGYASYAAGDQFNSNILLTFQLIL